MHSRLIWENCEIGVYSLQMPNMCDLLFRSSWKHALINAQNFGGYMLDHLIVMEKEKPDFDNLENANSDIFLPEVSAIVFRSGLKTSSN